MYTVLVRIQGGCGEKRGVVTEREVSAPRLADAMVQALLTADTLTVDGVSLSPLLVDWVSVDFRFDPTIPRENLRRAWAAALCDMIDIVDILPEGEPATARDPGNAARARGRR